LRRYVQHVLPHRFVRIRQFGFLANRHRSKSIALIRHLLASEPQPQTAHVAASGEAQWQCPRCGNLMQISHRLTARELYLVIKNQSAGRSCLTRKESRATTSACQMTYQSRIR
jgi:hypothetical protein